MANDDKGMIQGTPGIADSYTAMVPAAAWDGNKLDLATLASSVRGWLQARIAIMLAKPLDDESAAIADATARDAFAVLADGLLPDAAHLNHNVPDSYALQHEAAQRFELPWPGFVS